MSDGKLLLAGSDHAAWRQFKDLIRDLGFDVTATQDCRAAYESISNDTDVELVVIDADTADECGARLARRMQSESRLAGIPLIVAGTKIDRDIAARLLSLKVKDIVILPTDPDTLQAKLQAAMRQGRGTILIVDDEEGIRQILVELLEFERFKVDAVASAEEALEAIRKRQFDVVVTDIVLPGIDGVELMKRVKQSSPGTPVVLITGYSGRYRPAAAVDAGADGYFTKPFKRVELVFTLSQLMQKRATAAGSPHSPHAVKADELTELKTPEKSASTS